MTDSLLRPFVVVTGGSSGIGLALARQFADNGHDVMIVAQDPARLAIAAAELAGGGTAVTTHAADLSREDAVAGLYTALQATGRPVDVLCVNAGVGLGGRFVDTDLARELEMIDLNVRGAVQLTKLVLQDMVARDAGKILLSSSIAATMPDPFQAIYGSTKAFLRWFGEALRNELKHTGVGVTVLMPNVTHTDFFRRADMLDTPAGGSPVKDDPAHVAKAAYDALMAGKDKVVPGVVSKIMAAINEVLPDPVAAQLHRTLFKPAHASDTPDGEKAPKDLSGIAPVLGAVLVAAGAVYAIATAVRGSGGLTKVAGFDHQVTGVSVAPDGRIFVNFPRWTDDAPISVAELMPDGSLRPYPDAQWNAWRNAKASELPVERHFVCVQSIVADAHGALWVLDPAAPGNEKILPGGPKLVRIDLSTNGVTKVIGFPEAVVLQGSYLNDIRFSPDGKTGYITDSGTRGAIIVVDLDTGASFRALDGHASTQPEDDVVVEVDGKPLRRPDGRQPVFSADGIALSNDGATLFFQALTARTLYAIETRLLTPGVSDSERIAGLRAVGRTHVADGLWMNRKGDLYITSPSDNAVKRWTASGPEIVVQDARLRWPDTMSEGPDGTLYVSASHIQDTNWFKPGAPASLPTALFSFKPK